MEYIDKILKFSTIEDLKAEILRDRKSKDVLSQRYGVRFLMLNNFADYNEIFTFISKELGVSTLHLENLALGDDKTITGDMLLSAIKELKESAIVAPFSELVRFYSEERFRGFFNEIILHEDISNPHKRIYIPIIGLHNRFCDFLKNFGRIAESAPIWQYYSSDDQVLVYVAMFKSECLPSKMGVTTISTMKDWLKFWKTIAPVDKILCSAHPIKNSYKHSKPDSIFTFHPIENAYHFISEFLDITVPIPYRENEEEFWEQLLNVMAKKNLTGFSLDSFVKDHFNKVHIDVSAFIGLWATCKSDFDRWLLKEYGLNSHLFENNPYLRICVDETKLLTSPYELFGNIASRIFHLFTQAEQNYFATERYSLMSQNTELFRSLVQQEVQENIKNDLTSIVTHDNNFANAKKLLTGIFEFEKLLCIGWYSVRNDNDFSISDVQKFYPNLYAYLQSAQTLDTSDKLNWLVQYLQDYKIAKMTDCYTEVISDTIAAKNGSSDKFFDWFYSLEDEHELLADAQNNHMVDTIYWIDGLSAEFIPYIEWLLKSSSYEIVHSKLARTGLPSNTHLNSFKVNNINFFKIGDLDESAHDDIYRKYRSLQKELEVLEQIIFKIIEDNSISYHNIAIVSDHGLTSLSRLVESKKLSKEAKHEGRYILLDNGSYVDDEDFVIVQNCGSKYKVALNHASLGKKPVREVHGGCTPEEIVVPFLIISNNPNSKKTDYKIKIINNKIPVSAPKIEIDILPVPEEVSIEINGKQYNMNKGKYWNFNIENAIEGVCYFTITPTNGNAISRSVTIYGLGATTDNPFDDF